MRMPTKKFLDSSAFWMKSAAGATAAGTTAIVLTGTLIAGPLVLGGYDMDSINSSIATAVKGAIADSSVIESAVVTIDGAVTDLEKDTYKFDKSFVLKKAPWTKGKVEASMSVTAMMNRSDNPEKGSVGLDVKLGLKTETLAFLKMMNQKKLKRCASLKESGMKSIASKAECGLAADVVKAKDLKEIAALIQGHTTSAIEGLESFVASSKSVVESQSSVLLKDEGKKLLEKTKRKLHVLKSIKVDLVGEGFSLTMDHAASRHPGCKIKHLAMVLSPDSASVLADVSMRVPTMVYDAVKPEVANMLKGLEDGREFAVEQVAAHARVHERLMSAMFAKASKDVAESGHASGQDSDVGSGQESEAMELPLNILQLNEVSGLNL